MLPLLFSEVAPFHRVKKSGMMEGALYFKNNIIEDEMYAPERQYGELDRFG